MTGPHPIILASTSPYRRMLLDRLGLAYAALAPQVEEDLIAGEVPRNRAVRLARAKAAAIAAQHPASVVIGSDQVASLPPAAGSDGNAATVLRKPGDRAACRLQLAAMSGRAVHFDTAVSVRLGAIELTHNEPTVVQFRELTAAQIEHYMDREPAFDCAGGFKCEGVGVTLFQSVESRDPTALVGLPLIQVCAALRQLGVPV